VQKGNFAMIFGNWNLGMDWKWLEGLRGCPLEEGLGCSASTPQFDNSKLCAILQVFGLIYGNFPDKSA